MNRAQVLLTHNILQFKINTVLSLGQNVLAKNDLWS